MQEGTLSLMKKREMLVRYRTLSALMWRSEQVKDWNREWSGRRDGYPNHRMRRLHFHSHRRHHNSLEFLLHVRLWGHLPKEKLFIGKKPKFVRTGESSGTEVGITQQITFTPLLELAVVQYWSLRQLICKSNSNWFALIFWRCLYHGGDVEKDKQKQEKDKW